MVVDAMEEACGSDQLPAGSLSSARPGEGGLGWRGNQAITCRDVGIYLLGLSMSIPFQEVSN